MLTIKHSLAALAAISFFAGLPAHAADAAVADTATTVVLVHGAFADGSSWNKVIPLLRAKGLKVVAVQNPLTSLTDDVAAAQRVIDAQTGKVVLVGHSWGGTVITQAGTSDKVKALVYVAALVPSEGQNSADLGKDYPPTEGIKTVKPDAAGFLYLPEDSVATNFAQDLPAAEAKLIAVTQGPIQSKAFGEQVSVAAWKTKPNYYIVAAKDRMIQPALEQAFAKKINAVTTVLQTSHVPMLSQPRQVADVIIKAAETP
jgi:pimeloyl-ACP methyl ester carboxylesterase